MLFLTGLIPALTIFFSLITLVVVTRIFLRHYQRNQVISSLESIGNSRHMIFKKIGKQPYDFILENSEVKLFIKVCYIPRNSAVTINSRNTWCLTYGGRGSVPGHRYSEKRYLTELVPFLEFNDRELHGRKAVVLYPCTNKIQKYLNESELAIIGPKQNTYGYHVINFTDLESRFGDLL